MALITASGLGRHYGTQVCFEGAEFSIAEGERVGLIGANGTGKTTIFRIMLGTDEEYDGTVNRKKSMRVAALAQDPVLPAGWTVREAVLAAVADIADLEKQMHEIHDRLAKSDGETEKLLARLSELESAFETAGGYALENRADRLLDGVGFPKERHGELVDGLSGGGGNTVALAQLLMVEPELWLLDEPTNHLDLEGVLFLENLLEESEASAVVISHDRRFLDAVTTRTLELEGQKLYSYPGSYTRARHLRDERLKSESRAFERQQEFVEKEQDFIRRYGAGQRAAQAMGRRKRLDRLVRLETPFDRVRVMHLNLPVTEKPSHRVLALRDLSMGYGAPLFEGVSLEVERGEVIGVVGPNGAGKTTLVRGLLGEMQPMKGRILWGERVKRGVLTQLETFPDESTTPFGFIRACQPQRKDQEIRNTLGAMLFRGDEVDKPVRVLSGGERKRLMLTRLLLEGNNVLVLDEPTNHLDLPSRETLELALGVFEGTLIAVSHDRYFLDQVADRVLWLENGQGWVTEGGFTEAFDAHQKRQRAAEAAARPVAVVPVLPKVSPKAKVEAAEERPHVKLKTAELEEKIMYCEERLQSLRARFADPAVFRNSSELATVKKEIAASEKELKELETEYARRTS